MILLNAIKTKTEIEKRIIKSTLINLELNSISNKPAYVELIKNIKDVFYVLNGYYNNYCNIPAFQRFMDGILIESNSYKRGILEDFDDNNPAIVTYYSNGNVKFYSRYNSGRLNNSKTGLSAHQEFYPNGNIRVCCYYKNGKLEDFNGVAAYRYYNLDGYITICENYCDGVKI